MDYDGLAAEIHMASGRMLVGDKKQSGTQSRQADLLSGHELILSLE